MTNKPTSKKSRTSDIIQKLTKKDLYSVISRCENRPWGWFFVLEADNDHWIKLIIVEANQKLSLQTHQYRHERWDVIKGSMIVEIDGAQHIVKEGQSITIPIHAKHRAHGLDASCAWIEYATAANNGPCSEDDIVRYQDNYGRAKTES